MTQKNRPPVFYWRDDNKWKDFTLSRENNPPEIEKAAPLKPQERLKYQLFKQYKSHPPIKYFYQ